MLNRLNVFEMRVKSTNFVNCHLLRFTWRFSIFLCIVFIKWFVIGNIFIVKKTTKLNVEFHTFPYFILCTFHDFRIYILFYCFQSPWNTHTQITAASTFMSGHKIEKCFNVKLNIIKRKKAVQQKIVGYYFSTTLFSGP